MVDEEKENNFSIHFFTKTFENKFSISIEANLNSTIYICLSPHIFYKIRSDVFSLLDKGLLEMNLDYFNFFGTGLSLKKPQ